MPQAKDYYFGYFFFAPQGRFEPCGMFTFEHIIGAIVCLIAVFALLVLYRHGKWAPDREKIYRFSAVLLTLLEIIKISHSFIFGDFYLDAWFPLSYCGLFIFALWTAGFGKKRFKRIGESFIAYGCPFAGVAFLIFPTTSLMIFPIWHYFSLYSMFFHSLMIYVGIISLFNEKTLDKSTFLNYALFVFIFAIPAICMNSFFESNLMNLREPYNIPIELIQSIYRFSETLYTVMVLLIYMLIPFFIGFIGRKIKIHK